MFLGSGPMSLLGTIGLVAKTFIKRGIQPSDAPFIMQRKDRVRAVLIGAVFGYIVGLTSVGSGTFFGLVMVMIYPLTTEWR